MTKVNGSFFSSELPVISFGNAPKTKEVGDESIHTLASKRDAVNYSDDDIPPARSTDEYWPKQQRQIHDYPKGRDAGIKHYSKWVDQQIGVESGDEIAPAERRRRYLDIMDN